MLVVIVIALVFSYIMPHSRLSTSILALTSPYSSLPQFSDSRNCQGGGRLRKQPLRWWQTGRARDRAGTEGAAKCLPTVPRAKAFFFFFCLCPVVICVGVQMTLLGQGGHLFVINLQVLPPALRSFPP